MTDQNSHDEIQYVKVRRRKRKSYFFRVFAASLAAGFLTGFLAAKIMSGGSPTKDVSPQGGSSWLLSVFGKNIELTGKTLNGDFVFSDFEKDRELKAWRRVSASLDLSDQFFSSGSRSARITFHYRDEEFGSVAIDDLMKSRRGISNWSGYRELSFSVRNPSSRPEVLNLLVVDIDGKYFKAKLELSPAADKSFSIPVERIAAEIDFTRVNQISFYHRMRERKEFFLDHLRLTAGAASNASSYYPSALTPASSVLGFTAGQPRFAAVKQAWSRLDPALPSPIIQIPFVVKNETKSHCFQCPVDGGIPFPSNELHDLKNLRLRNGFGEDLPFQARILSKWPDGSAKWVHLHFLTTLEPGEGLGFYFEYGPDIRTPDFPRGVKVEETAEHLIVDTGAIQAILNKKKFTVFEKLLIDRNGDGLYAPDEVVADGGSFDLRFRGTEYRTEWDQRAYEIKVEERGHQKVSIRASSWYVSEGGDRFCKAIVRYTFYAAKSQVMLSHTLIYTGYPENKQFREYKNLSLPENEKVEQYGMRLPLGALSGQGLLVSLGQSKTGALPLSGGDEFEILQTEYDRSFVKIGGAAERPEAPLTQGWVDVSDTRGGVTVAMRNFRENFPKKYRFDGAGKNLIIDYWPAEAGALDLSTTRRAVGPDAYGRGSAFGLAKTHETLIYFHRGRALDAGSSHVSGAFAEPLVVRPNPYWVEATEAVGRLYPIADKYVESEQMLHRLFGWAERHPKNFRWYGMLNFGDTLSWWRDKDETKDYGGYGWHPVGRWGWYNNEGVGLHTGALLQFLRGGDWRYFDFAENLTWHLMDIDTVHYDTISNDSRLSEILDKKYSQVGSMHRHNGDHWGGRSDEASHSNVFGLLLYYYMTGNERAFEVANEMGSFFLSQPMTYAGHPDIAPARAIANILWGDVLLFEATGDIRYKDGAHAMAQILMRGQQPDGSYLENYNPVDKTWSGGKNLIYMSGYITGALISYHQMTQDGSALETLSRMLRYLSKHEYAAQATLHGFAYAYLKTFDNFYLDQIKYHMPLLMRAQHSATNPLLDGLIYQKPIYHRPMVYLSTIPYIYSAMEEAASPKEV